MADTIITNTPDRRSDDSGAVGLIVALIILLAILVAGFVWYRHGAGIPNTGGGTNINVTVPNPVGGGGGSTGGGTTGGSSGGTGGATQ